MFRFHKKYFLITILLFIVEVLIALYMHDRLIRPYVGDLLVVILIYYFVKTFFDLPPVTLALCVLAFAYFIEFTQYIHLVDLLGLQHSRLASTVMGTSFEWMDILAYTVGILIVIGREWLKPKAQL